MFTGSLVALVTPFRKGEVDVEALKRLVDWQIREGTQGLVPCGTTGESATLSVEEHHQVVALTVEAAAGRVPVLAGTGSNNTAEAIQLTRAAKQAGAAGALLIAPYYNKPTQEGLYRHYLAVAEATDFPFVLYNIQSRTGVNVQPATIARIARACPLLVGVKEASGDLKQIGALATLLDPAKVAILSGDDALTLPIAAVGGKGVISVVANLLPGKTAAFTAACLAGDLVRARAINGELLPLVQALFTETSPGPLKAAMAMAGLCDEEIRLPLVPAGEGTRAKLREAMQAAGVAPAGAPA